jgi:hypothetical protein
MKDPLHRSLDDLLAGMPRDIAPRRNLWPGIAGRLRGGRRRTRPLVFALAAGLAGACVASALTWAVLHERPTSAPLPLVAARAPNFDEPNNPRYVAARVTLEANFRERLVLLDPATRTKIEASLEVIRHAHEDIRKALANDPASPVLEQLWQSTWRDELDLYDRVVQATQPAMTRT